MPSLLARQQDTDRCTDSELPCVSETGTETKIQKVLNSQLYIT